MFVYERDTRCSSVWIFYGYIKYVKNLEVNYKGINVLETQALREGIKEFSDWPTIPQIYIKGEFIGGCDIVKEMYENGELKKVLEDKGINFKK